MSDIIKTQRSLAIKAKYQKEHQFDHLYRLICRQDWIKEALDTIGNDQTKVVSRLTSVENLSFERSA
jgi:hypothetical protein